MNTPLLAIFMTIVSYFIGSISSAIVICRMMGYPDPRSQGSNNPGATNVLRIGGKKAAAFVLVFDVLKATLPVLLGHALGLSYGQLSLIGMAAVVGHIFPIYYQFEGGKGVATALGMYFGLNWLFGLACAFVWLATAKLSKYSSLSSLVMVGSAPFIAVGLLHSYFMFIPLAVVSLVVAIRHKENIARLKAGTESQTKI